MTAECSSFFDTVCETGHKTPLQSFVCPLPSLAGMEGRLGPLLNQLLSANQWSSGEIADAISAVQEAWLNAAEHGHHFRAEFDVLVQASMTDSSTLNVRITDHGLAGEVPRARPSLKLGWRVIEAFTTTARLYTRRATRVTTAELVFIRSPQAV